MRRVSEGDEASIAEFYDRFSPLVFRLAGQMLSRPEAEDAVQEVFVRLWRTADRYDGDRSALVTWVLLITRRHLVDRLRRAKARIRMVSADGSPGWGDASVMDVLDRDLVRQDDFRKLMRRIEELPELQRIVVTRSYLGGQSLRQIAEHIGAPLGTIKSALSRALLRLRERSATSTGPGAGQGSGQGGGEVEPGRGEMGPGHSPSPAQDRGIHPGEGGDSDVGHGFGPAGA